MVLVEPSCILEESSYILDEPSCILDESNRILEGSSCKIDTIRSNWMKNVAKMYMVTAANLITKFQIE